VEIGSDDNKSSIISLMTGKEESGRDYPQNFLYFPLLLNCESEMGPHTNNARDTFRKIKPQSPQLLPTFDAIMNYDSEDDAVFLFFVLLPPSRSHLTILLEGVPNSHESKNPLSALTLIIHEENRKNLSSRAVRLTRTQI